MLLITQILMKWQKMKAVGISRQWAACSRSEGKVNEMNITALAERVLGQLALAVVLLMGAFVPFHSLFQEAK